MSTMRAVRVREPGGPEQLTIGEAPKPVPGEQELLVQVHTTALNRADTFQRAGKYPHPEGASPILGLEMAGTVAGLGPGASGWNLGDRVFGLLPGGGYAEYVTLHQDMAMSVPPGLSFEEAAAIPEVFLTAYQALYWLGELKPDERVLIHAGGSGVGTAAIQLTREANAHPFITASAPKHDRCRELGAELTIDYREEDFAERIQEKTGGQGVNIILDFIGAPYFKKNVRALALDGRLVMLSTLGGSRLEQIDLRKLFAKRAFLIATTLRSRSPDYKIELTKDFAGYALPHFIDGTLQPVIDRVMDWTDVAEAHEYMEANKNTGKIVLRVASAGSD